jgi:hypothetical protein
MVALNGGRHCGEFGVGEIDRRHGLAGPSRTEVPGDNQSVMASPQTEVASGQSISDDEQCDEPERERSSQPRSVVVVVLVVSLLVRGLIPKSNPGQD